MCDKEVNTENLDTSTGFRKGVHWRHQCIKRNFYRIGAHNEARDIVYQACKIANMEVEHEPPGLYAGVAKAPADLLIDGISDVFEHTTVICG